MNIAYCFSGHLRTFRLNCSLSENLIRKNPGDIFIHTFRKRNNPGPQWHNDRSGSDDDITDDDIKFIENEYGKPKKIVIDERPCGASYMPEGCENMGYRFSLNMSKNLMLEHSSDNNKNYDIVFMSRFDLAIMEPFCFPEKTDKCTVYGSYNLNQIRRGNDSEVFWYGSPDVINEMLSPIMPDSERDMIAGYGMTGELLFTSIRKRLGFKYENHKPIKCGLIRSWGMLEIET